MDLSIVISLFNEEESLRELVEWIDRSLAPHKYTYEIIMVDDGSTDRSWEVISALSEQYPQIRAIGFRRNYGKSAALYCGFEAAQGDIVVTMDADLQDSPEEIPEMIRMIREDGYDLTGIKLHDMNCGLKAYRNEVVKNIEVYGEMHRFIPYLAKNAGFSKIGEKVVHHQARKYGKSKFGMSRFIHGFLDLLSIWFLQKFGKKPMHLFGGIGTLLFLVGAVLAIWLIVAKLVAQSHGAPFRPVADQPLFFLALVAVLLGAQLFLTGFLGELVARNAQDRNRYNIKRTIR